MPIKPENRHLYPPNWKSEIRPAILLRAGNRCERCEAPNGVVVCRDADTYMLETGEVYESTTGEFLGMARGTEYPGTRFVKIVLTIAHLDHNPTNCAPENLAAWCQKCHLDYDRAHHIANAHATRRARKAASNLPGIG